MIKVDIRSNISSVINFVRNQPAFIRMRTRSNLRRIGKFIQRESRKNAPYKTGQLRRDIKYRVSGDKIVVFVRGKSEDYATIMHDGEYRRGKGTVRKGGRAGNMYIQRALDENNKHILTMLGDIY